MQLLHYIKTALFLGAYCNELVVKCEKGHYF
jgi:hypothetical protein